MAYASGMWIGMVLYGNSPGWLNFCRIACPCLRYRIAISDAFGLGEVQVLSCCKLTYCTAGVMQSRNKSLELVYMPYNLL